MQLIGMLDSPFVRRVAVTLKLLGHDFVHRNWSVGKDFDQIRAFNPLGRVPTLVLDDGTVLCESSAILDWIDEQAGARALLPRSGPARQRALQLMALATGAAEKGVLQLYEGAFRPAEKRHQPWVDRCRAQMDGALGELDKAAAARNGGWLVGDALSQADITVACVYTFASEALQFTESARFPALKALAARCEAMPVFRAHHQPFFVPNS
jgi:glutathione S-transferase